VKGRILIIDDEVNILKSLGGICRDEGYQVEFASSGEEGLLKLERENFDVVLLDIWLPGMDGLHVLKETLDDNGDLPVIMISGHGTISTAVEAVKMGAFDFLEKPLSIERVLITVERALTQKRLLMENKELKKRVKSRPSIVGFSKPMAELRETVKTAAPTDAPVLIRGENGTGKELVARLIHEKSGRRDGPFVAVNCAAIPEGLIESELFGHVKGAFTGAVRTKTGKAEQAHGGTLFLDEIGDMSGAMQAKLLRFLEDKLVEKVGGNRKIPVDIRVVTATHRDLEKDIKMGTFREDLYFRINVVPLHVPPLRERIEDIPYLAKHFLESAVVASGRVGKTITPEAIEKMKSYRWPGNVRELRNIVERLFILSKGEEIGCDEVDAALGFPSIPEEERKTGYPDSYRESLLVFEKEFLLAKLKENGMNISRTAERIGLDRSSIHRKLKALGIQVGGSHENSR